MKFYLLRRVFIDLFLKNFWKFLFLFFFVFSTLTIFIPIIKSEYDLFVKQQTIKKTQKFNTFLTLPDYSSFSNLKEKKKLQSFQETIDDILIPYKNEYQDQFDYYVRSSTEYNNFVTKKNYSFETGFFSEKNSKNYRLESVHLHEGSAPNPGTNEEVVLNEKYVILNREAGNKIDIGDDIKLFGKNFEIVGIGDSAVNFLLNPKKTYLVPNSLKLEKKDNLYLNSGIVYVNNSLFNDLQKQSYFTNYQNNLYLIGNDQILEKIIPEIKKEISSNFDNFYSRSTNYQNDVSSGLREYIFYLEFILFGIILIFASVFIIIFSIDIVFKYLKKNKIFLKNLYSFGYKVNKVTNFYSLLFFSFFFLTSIISYFVGFIPNFFWTNANNYLFFVHISYQPFSWSFFFIFTFFISFFYGILIWIYLYLKLRSKKERWLFMFYSTFHEKYQKKLFFQKFINFFNIKKPLFFLFLKNFRAKFFLLLSILFVFFFFFSLIFINVGGHNFFYNRWNFLQNDVKSFTKFKNNTININKKTNKIEANVLFIDENLANDFIPLKSLSIDNIKLDDILSCINFQPISEINNQNLKCFLKKTKIEKKTLKNSYFQTEMEKYGVDDVYFNFAPYNKKKELPLLTFDSFSTKNNQKIKSKVYFMPSNWKDFFKLDQLSNDNLKLQNDQKLGVDVNGYQRALVSGEMKKLGYQLNDIIDLNYYWENKEGNINSKFRFVIGGFVNDQHLMQNIIFTDYDYLLKNNFLNNDINDQKYPYNFIFSKTEKKHLRHLVLNFNDLKIKDVNNLFNSGGKNNKIKNLEILSPVNQESLTITEYNNLFIYSFNVVRFFLYLILFFGFFVGLLIIFFLFSSMLESFNRFLDIFVVFGYRLRELITFDFLNFLIPLFFSFFIAFILNYGLFNFISLKFLTQDLFFIFDFFIYFIYAFILFVFLISSYFIYNFFYFYKNKKNLRNYSND